jgi:hypothetical protein
MMTSDVFSSVLLLLSGASLESLGALMKGYSGKVAVITKSNSMFFIIDEAQAAGEACMGAFLSHDGKTEGPVLRPIVRYFGSFPANIKVIVSGTGFSLELFKNVAGSPVAKAPAPSWEVRYTTGNFFDREVQLRHVDRYLPSTYLDSASGKHLKIRIWTWLRGRCVATKVLASQLNRSLQAQVHSPLSGRGVSRSVERQLPNIST